MHGGCNAVATGGAAVFRPLDMPKRLNYLGNLQVCGQEKAFRNESRNEPKRQRRVNPAVPRRVREGF